MTELLVAEALKRSKGNQNITAQFLGITRQALGMRLKKIWRARGLILLHKGYNFFTHRYLNYALISL